MLWQGRGLRKPTGGKYHKFRDKRKRELGRIDVLPTIGEEERKVIRVMGGNKKVKAVKLKFVNVRVGKKVKRVEIKKVVDNPANRHYKRMGVITKGAIVETELGKVRITNRPSQEGFANGVLVK